MNPTEAELTVAVDAGAKAFWEDQRAKQHGLPSFNDMEPMNQFAVRELVLPVVSAALSALPDRTEGLQRQWGRRVKDGSGGFGTLVGQVSSLYGTREEAIEGGNGLGLWRDQELVVRRVTEWEPDPEGPPTSEHGEAWLEPYVGDARYIAVATCNKCDATFRVKGGTMAEAAKRLKAHHESKHRPAEVAGGDEQENRT